MGMGLVGATTGVGVVSPTAGGQGEGLPVTPGVWVAATARAFGSATPRERDDDAPATPYTFVSLLSHDSSGLFFRSMSRIFHGEGSL